MMTHMARPQTMQPLADDLLARYAPSAFAPHPHKSRSEKYAYLSTVDMIDALRGEGFLPVWAAESRTRNSGKRGFCKHMIRFRHASKSQGLRQTYPEVVLVNSHDGSSTWQLHAGIFRFLCSNGMIVADGRSESIRLMHKGGEDTKRLVIEGTYEVLDSSTKALARVDEWSSIRLTRDEQLAFAEAAHAIRFARPGDTRPPATPIRPEQLLIPRRSEDSGNDLWNTFNVVQENASKGGLSANTVRGRRVTTKPVTAIDGDLRLQRGLWMLGERMAEIKARG